MFNFPPWRDTAYGPGRPHFRIKIKDCALSWLHTTPLRKYQCVKSVSGPARHVGEADKRVRDSRGGSPCGENRCGIGECREGEGTRGAPQERAKLTRTIFFILRSEVSSIETYDAPRRMVFFDLSAQLWRGKVIISQSIYDFLIGDPNIILFCIDLLGKRLFFVCKKNPEDFSSKMAS